MVNVSRPGIHQNIWKQEIDARGILMLRQDFSKCILWNISFMGYSEMSGEKTKCFKSKFTRKHRI